MKQVIFIILGLGGSLLYGQSKSVTQLREVVVQTGDTIIKTNVQSTSKELRFESGNRYYWYGQGRVYSNFGGSGGKLLHGNYSGFVDGHLVVSGSFRNGLKDGTWSIWEPDGALISQIRWKNGHEISDEKRIRRAERQSGKTDKSGRIPLIRRLVKKNKVTGDD